MPPINLGNYVDYKTAKPVQNPLDIGPSVGAMVGEGISELANTIDEQVQKMNHSKFVIESTKYLSERKLYEEDIQKQVLAGYLDDRGAKEEMSKYDQQASARYQSIIPKPMSVKFGQLVELEQVKTNDALTRTYQKQQDDKFIAEFEITYNELKKDPDRKSADARLSGLLADPRIPEDKKLELEYKYHNERDTITNNEAIQRNEYAGGGQEDFDINQLDLDVLKALMDNPKYNKYLTAEQVSEYKMKINDQIERNKDLFTRQQEAITKEQEATNDKITKDYIEQVNSIYPVSAEVSTSMSKLNPELYKVGQELKREYTKYQDMTPDDRQKYRDQAQRDFEAGKYAVMDALGGYAKVISTLDSIDREMDTREKTDPVGVYNDRYKTNLKLDDRAAAVRSLEINGHKRIPYNKSELDQIKSMGWTTPENKTLVLKEFLANSKGAKDQNRALFDQIDAVAPKDQVPKYNMYARLIGNDATQFDADGNVVTNVDPKTQVDLATALMIGDDLNMKLGKDFYDEIKDESPLEQEALKAAYKYVISTSNGTLSNLDKEGKAKLNEQALNRAKVMLYGDVLKESGVVIGRNFYIKRGNYPAIRLPLGMSSEQAHEKINTYVTNFSTFTGVSTNDISSYNLVEVPNQEGSLMYVDAKGRPLLYGYTNDKGDDLTPNKTATNTKPVPFIIDLTGNQKGNVNTKLKDKLLPQTKETMAKTAQELAKEREYRTKYVGK
ncbi:hypothetical protein EKK58_09825 [Candidatus Dependentiae bacterium]|nr:MAG: hypothetical protein EKK58_09825 [Candidatus Dependentiae bacterium]